MKLLEKLVQSERYALSWKVLLLQGIVIGFMGGTLGLASVSSPDAVILNAREFSWLPMCGMVILSLGIVECLDAFLAKEMRDFLQNLQVGVLDAVIGGLILFGISGTPQRLSLMIAAYLIVRGIVRIVLVYALHLPNALSTAFGGLVSVVLGIMVFVEWPSTASWFLALCLNVEISFRGWAICMFALWVRQSAQAA